MHKAFVFAVCCLLTSAAAVAQKDSGPGHKQLPAATSKTMGDFNLANRFSVEIAGVTVAGVHPIDNLNALVTEARGHDKMHETQSDIVEYKDGEDGVNRTRPGNHKPGKITLTKDWSNTLEWTEWYKNVLDGKVDRRSISIIFHNDAGAETGRMNYFNCWPVKHNMPSSAEKNSGHAAETIELSCDRLDWKGK